MKQHLHAIKQSEFLRHNAIFFFGSLAVAVVNYLYYPIIGRSVSTTEFGEVQTLISILMQISLLLLIIGDVTINIVSNSKDAEASNRVIIEFGRLTQFIMLTIVVIALIFLKPVKHFFHFQDVLPFILTGIMLITYASNNINIAFLRGKNEFTRISIINLLSAISKLVLSFIFISIGYGTSGAIGGILAASFITLLYAKMHARKLGLHAPKDIKWWRLPDMKLIKPQLPFAALVLVVSLVTTAFFSIDVVIAKHYFSPEVAGEYAGIATVGRIIFYLTGSVAGVLLSSVKLKHSIKQNRRTFLLSLGLTTLLGGSVTLAFALFPSFFINLLIGEKYLLFADLLPKLSLTLFLISIINLLFSYDVALRRWSIGVISIVGACITIGLMVNAHDTPYVMINSLLQGSLVLLGLRALDSLRRNLPILQR